MCICRILLILKFYSNVRQRFRLLHINAQLIIMQQRKRYLKNLRKILIKSDCIKFKKENVIK